MIAPRRSLQGALPEFLRIARVARSLGVTDRESTGERPLVDALALLRFPRAVWVLLELPETAGASERVILPEERDASERLRDREPRRLAFEFELYGAPARFEGRLMRWEFPDRVLPPFERRVAVGPRGALDELPLAVPVDLRPTDLRVGRATEDC